jgi:hypothetical protein
MANEEYLPPENESSLEITEIQPSALAVLNQSEHAAMVTTANLSANRRNLEVFGKKLMSYATHSQPVALSMFYTLPRAGKQIIGASVRFAEVVAPCWKNNSTGSRIIGCTDDTVTAQGVFIDYEANMRNVKEIPRKITDKEGRKFNADMILTTSKAALSIAYREAILKGGVPMALWSPAYEQAKLTAVGQAMSHAQRIDAAMEYLTKLGVTEWQIMNAVGVSSPKELEIEHLVTLKTLCEEIKKGARTIEEVFGSQFDKEIDSLFTQLGKNETEKRLLKNSYMGRAKELVEYLRSRIPQATQSRPPQAQAQAEPSAAQASETEQAKTETTQETEKKRKPGRPTKVEMEARKAKEEQEQQASTQSDTQAHSEQTDQEEEPAQTTTNPVPEARRFSF